MRAAAEQQRASVAAQLDATRKQAQSLGASLIPWEPIQSLADKPACDPLPDSVVTPLIESAARSNGVQTDLIRAVIEQESGLRPCSESSKGAQGLMQLMPETADELGVADPFDPKQNIDAGAKHLKQLLDKYKGDLSQALGAYNAGANAASEAGGVPDIPETREYVNAILKKLAK